MAVFLHIIQGIFAVIAAGLFLGFIGAKHVGLLLAAIIYGGGAFASFFMGVWWPLPLAFAGAWGLRLLGFDPNRN